MTEPRPFSTALPAPNRLRRAPLKRSGNYWGSDPVIRKKLPRNPDPLTHRA